MKPAFHKLLIVCCALYLSGAHWMVLQVTAWTGMFVTRSQVSSVREALSSTLDGQHPCGLCRAIASGQKQERQEQPDAPWTKKVQEGKMVMMPRWRVPASLLVAEVVWPNYLQQAGERTEAPPTPPPVA